MAINPKIKRLFVLMMENHSYDHLLGWCDLRGWTPAGVATQADGLVGKPIFANYDGNNMPHPVGQGAAYGLASDPGHEFSDVLLQLCGRSLPAGITGMRKGDGLHLDNSGTYPPFVQDANSAGYAYCLDDQNQDVTSAMRCFSPEQVPVLEFLAHQFAVCDRWFSSMPGPTWPNRFFALAGTSWGLDHSPSDTKTLASEFFDGDRFGTGSDSILTRLAPEEWLVAFGDEDTAQSWALKGVDANGREKRFIRHSQLIERIVDGKIEDTVKFVFIEPSYHAIGHFAFGNSMHPLGDVRAGEALIKEVYEKIKASSYWEDSALLIVFDEHGGFFDHVIPDEKIVPDDKRLAPELPTTLTKHNFRFDRYGVRVPAIVISPYVRQATIDHTFYDHVSIGKTLSEIARAGSPQPLLPVNRFKSANSFGGLFTLAQPRAARDIPACPEPFSAPLSRVQAVMGDTERALLSLKPPW